MSVSRSPAPGRPLNSGGEFAFDSEDFSVIAKILHETSGIDLPESKTALVYSRLAKRLRSLGLESFRDYCQLIAGKDGADELGHMRDALTTNVTRFFREPHHFDYLRKRLLPAIAPRAKAGGKIRIWSAGCSTGQEPYSIALSILAEIPDARSYDIKILATDISSRVLGIARQARYATEEIVDIPADLRARWMEREADHHVFDDAVRSMVSVKHLNLMESWPMSGPFDAIFCRNVVIYFNEETQKKIWRRMVSLLAPGGSLFIGHSERVSGLPEGALTASGITTYQKPQRAAA